MAIVLLLAVGINDNVVELIFINGMFFMIECEFVFVCFDFVNDDGLWDIS